MASGVPIRLSLALTTSAREVASALDRSLTEQVEHWARLGQLVEATISGATMLQLKAKSYAIEVPKLIAFADSAAGKAKAVALIRERNEIRVGADPTTDAAPVVAITRAGKKVRSIKRR